MTGGGLAPLLSLVLAVLTAVSAAFVPAYYGSRKPGYSHVLDTISELGSGRGMSAARYFVAIPALRL